MCKQIVIISSNGYLNLYHCILVLIVVTWSNNCFCIISYDEDNHILTNEVNRIQQNVGRKRYNGREIFVGIFDDLFY